ncbi:hypothetical protein FSP39_017598 [Pinctada imbricata]|uniref:Uncharacterized protein n=1 Tax=Pinctada imbricata TaxID=66713 RepID=A0AA88Y3V2_PINIB|nr:hypothetical protein FSP39_017598 [Pinctada imbricata]
MNVSLALGILDKEIRRCRRFDSGGSKSSHDTKLSIDTLKTAITFCLNINHYDLFVRILEYMRILSFGIESSVFVNLNVGNVPILMYTRIGLLANLLGRKQITEYLISEAKINTGVADFLGNTMLHYSVVHGWESMTGDLIQKDETLLNCMNKNGETPILMAAKVTYEEDMVLFLMKRDADISIKDNNGYSLAHYAALKSWINVIKAIELKCPAILSERNMDGNSPVIAVFKKMSTYMTTTKTLRRLLRMSNISALIDGDGNNVLHFLIRQPLLQDDIDIIGSILEKESTLLNQSNNKGETPLTYATKYSYPFTSNIPLFTKEFPVDLHISDKQGNTALHYLAFNGMIDLVEYIIQKDVSVIRNTNENAQTPLLFAFTNKHLTASKSTKLIQCFRHHDIDLNTCDKDENGILHYVALWASYQDIASLETVETLLSYNKDLIYARNKFRQVPFVYLVCSRTSVRSDSILTRMNSQLFNLLVSENLYTEDPDETGNTLLHYICRFGVLADEMKVMPHTSRRNIFRMDPISYAACYGTTDESIVAMNLTDEICLSVDHFGRSILHYCSLHFWPNAVRTILEKHKYEENLVDKAGDTPLMLALKYGKIKDGALSTLFDEKACECISTLLRHKERVVVNQDGETMLHLYVAKTQVIREEIIEKAIQIDPDCLSKKNIHGLIPIMVRMKEKNKMNASEQYPFGRYYISNDDKLIPKDLFISDNDGNTVCHYCILHDLVGVVDIVKRGPTNILNEKNRNGESPLVYAAWRGKGMNVIERLLEIADLQCSDLNGNTLLHVCLVNGWVELAEKIVKLDKGLLNYRNRLGQTPPMLALYLGCQTEESLLRMMDFSPKLQYKDYLGNTLLHYCALRCYLPLVKKILAQDENLILLLNDEKQSATMYMMDNALLNWERAKPVLQFMLKFERRFYHKDSKGQNLIQYCSKSVIQTFFSFS